MFVQQMNARSPTKYRVCVNLLQANQVSQTEWYSARSLSVMGRGERAHAAALSSTVATPAVAFLIPSSEGWA